MAYNYSNGDGPSVLLTTEPNGATEPVSVVDQAIRQIKAYLNDPVAGPAALISALFPVGGMIPYGGASAPTGWLICDGTAVSRTTYATLFALVGTSFGSGNGTTTFNLPDFRDRALRGKSGSTTLGATGGSDTATLTAAQVQHQHTVGRAESNSGTTADDYRFLVSSDSEFSDTGSGQQSECERNAFDRAAINGHAGDWVITSEMKKFDPDPVTITNPYQVVNFIIKY